MKKILFAFSMMFALVACSYDDLGSIPQQPIADGPVQVRFSVQVPDMLQATRTMSSQEITSLKLVVFDENGYFVDDADATLIDYTGDDEDKVAVEVESDDDTPDDDNEIQEQTYTVSLPQSASPRTIHFIANLPANVEFEYGSERELINALETSGTADAYWQRKELSSILGKVVGQNSDGTPIVEATDELAKALNKIPLVRNFAKVSVAVDTKSGGVGVNNFTVVGIAIYNAPKYGKIAPYNTNAGEWAYDPFATTNPSYKTMHDAGYYGYVPELADGDFAHIGISEDGKDVTSTSAVQYLYEYNMDGKKVDAGAKYPFVIIKGTLNSGTYFYKVDLADADGNYYNILRNFEYKINITAVSEGFTSADAAAAAAASNNINASIDTRNLLNISDGTGRLYVEYTTKYITDVTKPFTLKYKYVPSIQQQNTVDNGAVDLTKVVAGAVIDSYSVAGSDDADGWRTITITPKAEFGKEQQITISARTISASTMSRTVTLHTVNPYALTVICPETVASSVGQPVQITLQVPENLPEAIFPLEFVIVSDQLSPDASLENMPVRTGLNADGTEGGQKYGFVKTVTYEEYQALTAVGGKVNIECNFKLSVAASEQGAVTTVNAYNPYFTCTSGSFVNVLPKQFTEINFTGDINRYGVGHKGTLTFKTEDTTLVTVTLTGLKRTSDNATTFTLSDATSYTVDVVTTNWGTSQVELTAEGYAQTTETATRNVLVIPENSLKAQVQSGSWADRNVTWYISSGSYNVTSLNTTIHFDADGTNDEGTLTYAGLEETSQLQLRYTQNNNTYRANVTVSNAASDEPNSITFERTYF